MNVKSATTVAVIGLTIGLLMTIASPFLVGILNNMTFTIYNIVNAIASYGGVLLFLLALRSGYKKQGTV